MNAPPEKLGSFFLGAEYDRGTGTFTDRPLTYDARDLTTHAVCVGMTGSGKTGLCIGLLEEAALDKVPALIIDPKGDITNLLLQFPELRAQDFRPWVNPDDARRKGMSEDDYAGSVASTWKNGLMGWGIGSARLSELRTAVDYAIYTPGSDAGLPISIVGSLSAPGVDFEENAESIREQIRGIVAALLGMARVAADPVRGREGILLAHIFEDAWKQGKDLDLPSLILSIQNPPIKTLGVFDLDTVYPPQDRFSLAMAFNNLLASPSFQGWLTGEPLDVARLLYTQDGTPRHSIFSLAHLSEPERMFFVTLLLESVLSWVRKQSGTTSLRAILYFDETFGFMPPVAEPPSKRPLLTLLKQSRAMGLGVVLVTQNPVDLDYKGLTNTGTWFIGKLQAERDKARVIEGLRGLLSQGGAPAPDFDALITGLKSRVFLMHNVHEGAPRVFHTRWAMSYLRGPLTKPQIRTLMEERRVSPFTQVRAAGPVMHTASVKESLSSLPPATEPSLPVAFVPVTVGERTAVERAQAFLGARVSVTGTRLVYEPHILGAATVRYADARRGVYEAEEVAALLVPPEGTGVADWNSAQVGGIDVDSLMHSFEDPGGEVSFAPVPERANSIKELKVFQKGFESWLYHTRRLTRKVHPALGVFQEAGEDERSFAARVSQAARERRDKDIAALEAKYAKKLDTLEARLERLHLKLDADKAEHEARKREEMVGAGETVLSFFMGRRRTTAATTISRKRRLTEKAKHEITETAEEIERTKRQAEELSAALNKESEAIAAAWGRATEECGEVVIKPKKADITVRLMVLAWAPVWSVAYEGSGRSGAHAVPAYGTGEATTS
ncbi:MAG: DUF87 domain-containing protein [Candidatus Methanofastidiosa archaeon]|nr:DUF87 domain-containing protein [Candidatus Methanofastidiosa archaeon]